MWGRDRWKFLADDVAGDSKIVRVGNLVTFLDHFSRILNLDQKQKSYANLKLAYPKIQKPHLEKISNFFLVNPVSSKRNLLVFIVILRRMFFLFKKMLLQTQIIQTYVEFCLTKD